MVGCAIMDWAPALKHLHDADPLLRPLIDRHGAPSLVPTTNAVQSRARALVGPQRSTKAAATIWGRFLDLYPKRRMPTGQTILDTPDTKLRAAGLSGAKAAAIKDLARPDVLPVGDLGIRKGMQLHFKLRSLPEAPRMLKLAAPWRPFLTVASWYMWRRLEPPA
jgi:DNA-3-methyladenine glycosylase II